MGPRPHHSPPRGRARRGGAAFGTDGAPAAGGARTGPGLSPQHRARDLGHAAPRTGRASPAAPAADGAETRPAANRAQNGARPSLRADPPPGLRSARHDCSGQKLPRVPRAAPGPLCAEPPASVPGETSRRGRTAPHRPLTSPRWALRATTPFPTRPCPAPAPPRRPITSRRAGGRPRPRQWRADKHGEGAGPGPPR